MCFAFAKPFKYSYVVVERNTKGFVRVGRRRNIPAITRMKHQRLKFHLLNLLYRTIFNRPRETWMFASSLH